jgi:hypothetical protein
MMKIEAMANVINIIMEAAMQTHGMTMPLTLITTKLAIRIKR